MNPAARLLSLPLLATAACQGPRSGGLLSADYPGTLQPPTALAVEAVWQQHVVASWRGPDGEPNERGFDAALQRRGGSLVVVGLSPMGSVGFSVTQGPDGVVVVNHIPDQMVIPPHFILLDVQRAFFPWAAENMSQGATGEIITSRVDERIAERYERGRLVERTFTRTSGEPAGTVHVSYEWGDQAWALPERAVLDNHWFDYKLTITTSSETLIPAEEAR